MYKISILHKVLYERLIMIYKEHIIFFKVLHDKSF